MFVLKVAFIWKNYKQGEMREFRILLLRTKSKVPCFIKKGNLHCVNIHITVCFGQDS